MSSIVLQWRRRYLGSALMFVIDPMIGIKVDVDEKERTITISKWQMKQEMWSGRI